MNNDHLQSVMIDVLDGIEAKVRKERGEAVHQAAVEIEIGIIIEGYSEIKLKYSIFDFLAVNPRRTNNMLKRKTPKKALRWRKVD